MRCYNYGSDCYVYNHGHKIVWFFCAVVLVNLIFELLNVLLLWKRARAPINLVLGKFEKTIVRDDLLFGPYVCRRTFTVDNIDISCSCWVFLFVWDH